MTPRPVWGFVVGWLVGTGIAVAIVELLHPGDATALLLGFTLGGGLPWVGVYVCEEKARRGKS